MCKEVKETKLHIVVWKPQQLGAIYYMDKTKTLHIVVWMPQQLDILGHRVSFHIDKTNKKKFKKYICFLNFEIIFFSIIYYNIVIWVVKIIQNVAYDNYDDFQHVNILFTNFHFTISRII
jgi:hypothetical protein